MFFFTFDNLYSNYLLLFTLKLYVIIKIYLCLNIACPNFLPSSEIDLDRVSKKGPKVSPVFEVVEEFALPFPFLWETEFLVLFTESLQAS